MKRILIISILLSCLLIVSSVSPVSAQIDFSRLKQAILTGIDRAVSRINNVESQIDRDPAISDVTKQIVIDGLDKVENYLLSYKSEVEKATTLEELRAINQEVIQYLRDNEDVIRENIREAILDIAEEASRRVEEFKEQVEQLLELLRETCPYEKETISEVEIQLQQLEDEMDILKEAIRSEDTLTIKQEINRISQLSKDIENNLANIQAACL